MGDNGEWLTTTQAAAFIATLLPHGPGHELLFRHISAERVRELCRHGTLELVGLTVITTPVGYLLARGELLRCIRIAGFLISGNCARELGLSDQELLDDCKSWITDGEMPSL